MISTSNITLRVGKKALFEDVNIKFTEGNCYGLIGANGAGKSTLMSISFGLYEPTSGKIPVREKQTKIADPNDANRLGIDMVHQHFKLVNVFTTL